MNTNDKGLKILAWIFLTGYAICILYWMFRGFGRTKQTEFRANLVPFKTIFGYIFNMNQRNIGTTIINLAGNIGVFIPFGVVLPYLFRRLRSYGRFITYFTGSIVVLEILQTVLKVGTGDIDDVILNVIGASFGFVFYRFFASKASGWPGK
ncbi:VanZ family protein [Paenibacillus sp.]|jgi:glycopeptide antibiotics resistance protein|uniref:VanZ family protein n=1 Tax=Paenibacillus sp. TaxID=58172 RepID=UPI0028380058|nr:VanZ family protein [Paenibacillus sp.]MDR0266530.1 VanZ family protein [Paenibacillus sp.]